MKALFYLLLSHMSISDTIAQDMATMTDPLPQGMYFNTHILSLIIMFSCDCCWVNSFTEESLVTIEELVKGENGETIDTFTDFMEKTKEFAQQIDEIDEKINHRTAGPQSASASADGLQHVDLQQLRKLEGRVLTIKKELNGS